MGIATYSYNRSTSGGEIIRELVNSTDGQGLHFNGSSGNIDIATPPNLGTKFSFEFILQADSIAASGYNYIADFGNGGGRFAIASIDGVLGIFDTNERLFAGVTFLDDLKVHHLVVTVDDTAAIAYDNGNQVGTATLVATSNIDSCTDAKIGSRFDGTPFFNGTIYRCRFWNKTLSQAEVTATYENATVPFADQYGVATNKITGAVDKNWGTAQADTGVDATDRATFNTNYVWNTYLNPTDISVASNLLTFTATAGNGVYFPTTQTVGKRYRITLATGTISGTFKVQNYNGSAFVDAGTLTASSTNVIEWIAPTGTTDYVFILATSTGTIQLNAASVSTEIVAAGCVSDYDLAFANPTQSLLVQARAGAADGTSSATGVTQCTPIVQVNATAARIGTSAATPADGEVFADAVVVGDGTANQNWVRVHSTASQIAGVKMFRGAGDSSDASNNNFGLLVTDSGCEISKFTDGGANITGRVPFLTIDSTGNVGVGVVPSHMVHAQATGTNQCLIVADEASNTFTAAMGVQNSPGVAQQAFVGTLTNQPFKLFTNNLPRVTIDNAGLATFSNGIKVNSTSKNYSQIETGTTVAIADDASITMSTSSNQNALVSVYDTSSGAAVMFFVSYATVAQIISDPSVYGSATDTDGKWCMIKTVNSHAMTFKNRTGSTRTFQIAQIGGQLV